jgi:hypothetical protein
MVVSAAKPVRTEPKRHKHKNHNRQGRELGGIADETELERNP